MSALWLRIFKKKNQKWFKNSDQQNFWKSKLFFSGVRDKIYRRETKQEGTTKDRRVQQRSCGDQLWNRSDQRPLSQFVDNEGVPLRLTTSVKTEIRRPQHHHQNRHNDIDETEIEVNDLPLENFQLVKNFVGFSPISVHYCFLLRHKKNWETSKTSKSSLTNQVFSTSFFIMLRLSGFIQTLIQVNY